MTATKLQPPSLRPDIMPRTHLLAALRDAIAGHPLTLISAPAGYGKTTLLAAFAQSYPRPSVWLSLDEEDNDPARFLEAMVAALRRAGPAFGTRAETMLPTLSDPAAAVRRVMGALVNDCLDAHLEAWVLIVDDLHLVTEPVCHVALEYLLDHLPAPLHVVVSSRHDPPLALARLRARGSLAELRMRDMRFSLDETEAFLNGQLHLGLTPDELAILDTGTEGWAAGLRLLGSSLGQIRVSEERAAFIDRLMRADTHVFDFLADEVLSRQSAVVRSFLLDTSILTDLVPDLCRAVTGRRDAAAVLEDAYRQNLFVVKVEAASPTYRYHHLFAEFLRRRLTDERPDHVVALHRKAAGAETVPARAVAHYLVAGLWEEAAAAVEQAGDQFLGDGLLHTLRSWIDVLPASVREAHPRLTYLLGLCALQRGELEQAAAFLDRAWHGFEGAQDEAGLGDAIVGLVDVASQQHDYPRQAALIDAALSRPLSDSGRAQVLIARLWQSINEGRWGQAATDLDEVLRSASASGEPRIFGIVMPWLRTHVALLPGGTGRLERCCRQALARLGEGAGPVQASAHSLLGYMSFLHGRLDQAVEEAERAHAISRQIGGLPFLDAEIDLVLAGVVAARGDYAAAEHRWLARLPAIEQTPAVTFWRANVLYLLGRAQWLQDHLEQARLTYARIGDPDESELPEATVARAMMRGLLDITARRYADGERTLQAAVAVEDANPQCLIFGSARLLLAHLYLVWQRPPAAAAALAPVLAVCVDRDMPGLILRDGPVVAPLLRLAADRGIHTAFALRVLGLFGEGASIRRVYVPDTGEALTSREVEVLRLITQGASNQLIKDQLVITEATAKSHVSSVLRKLNVTSRTQAASRARELGLG